MPRRPGKPTSSTKVGQPSPDDLHGASASADAGAAQDRRPAADKSLEARAEMVGRRELDVTERERRIAERENAMAMRDERMAAREAACLKEELELRARQDATAPQRREMEARERTLSGREQEVEAAQNALEERQRDVESREHALQGRERVLQEREATLSEREEELSVREAAVEEALSLVDDSQAAAAPPQPAASAFAEAAVPHAEPTSSSQDADERARVMDDTEQFLGLMRQFPALAAIEPNVQKALSGPINRSVLTSLYTLAIRTLADQKKTDAALNNRIASLQQALLDKQRGLEDANVQLSSLKEDFDRYRTRQKAEQETFTVRANEQLLQHIVPVSDNFNRALAAAEGASNVDAVLNGVRMIQRMFEDVLQKGGLVPIEATGRPFDPTIHEALMDVQMTDVPEGTVVEEVQRGYYLAGKVFRPALVKVARGGRRNAAATAVEAKVAAVAPVDTAAAVAPPAPAAAQSADMSHAAGSTPQAAGVAPRGFGGTPQASAPGAEP